MKQREALEHFIQRVPSGFAVTRGSGHTLAYANAAFGNLMNEPGEVGIGIGFTSAFRRRDTTAFRLLLDRAYHTMMVCRDRPVGFADGGATALLCTVWPDVTPEGTSESLLVELRRASPEELTTAIQRDVQERLEKSVLSDRDAAEAADVSRRIAAILAVESRRLAASLDEDATLAAMARMSLPYLGSWCMVDTLWEDGSMHRTAMIHSDPVKQMLFDEIAGTWMPALSDGFGLATILLSGGRSVIGNDAERPLVKAVRDPRITRVLDEVGDRPLLTVPLIIREKIAGAITFVGGRDGQAFSEEDITLAEDLAGRSATALDRARLFGEAVGLREAADSAHQAKETFLSRMSHELRTPLNAIGGFVDLMDLGLHGPVTPEQQHDLSRIRSNQQYLTGLIRDLLNLTQVGSGNLIYVMSDVPLREVMEASVLMLEPLIANRHLTCNVEHGEDDPIVSGDRDKMIQVVVNLLSNAIKFTDPGGSITLASSSADGHGHVTISDTGIGISVDKLDAIFEAFVQVRHGSTAPEPGIGLGLAISRSLARGMKGDLTARSTLGSGSEFTFTLPMCDAAALLSEPLSTP